MANVEEMIKSSSCFGLAYDASVKECKICEVRTKCKSKCEGGNVELPKKPASVALADKDEVSMKESAMDKSKAKEKDAKAKKPVKEKKKSEVNYSDDMPEDFKSMSMEELADLLTSRGGDTAEFEKYTADNIKRMRMTMAIKKTYEI